MTGGERHWLHVFATFDPGGPQVRTAQILGGLPRTIRHTVLAMDGRTGCAARVPGDVRMELLPRPPRRGSLRTALWLVPLLRRLRPSLLLTYNFGAIDALAAARLARQRAVVHHEEGFGEDEIERRLGRRNALRFALLRGARTVIVPSRTLERLAATEWRQADGRVVYLPNGVDVQRFRPAPRPPATEPVIGCVAAFRAVKNQQLLLRAFARLPTRASLLLVGEGEELAGCRALASELGVAEQTTFAGATADTAPCYQRMDLFACSSRTEQMPIAVLEAMASGLPVVSTDVGDVKEMVGEPGRDLVVRRDDPLALAAALERALGDSGLRARAGAANRARCEREFELGACLARYVAAYERVELATPSLPRPPLGPGPGASP